MTKYYVSLLALVGVVFGISTANAATRTWVPTTGGVWTVASNWSPSGVPTNGDSVIIATDQSTNITAVPVITLSNLTINGNCLLAAAVSGNTLTTTNFSVASGKTFSMGITG